MEKSALPLETSDDSEAGGQKPARCHSRSFFSRFVSSSRAQNVAIIVTITNVALVIAKLYAAIMSNSFSIFSSGLESAGDLFVGGVVLASNLLAAKNSNDYPYGRTVHALADTISAVIMITLAIANTFYHLEKMFVEGRRPEIDVSHFSILGTNIFLKALLFALCFFNRKHEGLVALETDQRNDVVTNIVTLCASLLATFHSWWWDVIGAVVSLVYIFYQWTLILKKSGRKIYGIVPKKELIEEIEKTISSLALTSSIRIIAVHRNEKIVVAVDAVFNDETTRRESRAILEKKISSLEIVSMAFVRDVDTLEEPKQSDEPSAPLLNTAVEFE